MRGGNCEEKMVSPMFPRVHVNDTEKGGPRAPPRNKMALYEQLSIPSQRFASGSASATPRPSTSSVPSTSSSQIVGHKRSTFSSFSKSSAQSHQVEKLHSHDSRGIKHNSMEENNEQKLVKTSLVTAPLSSTSRCNSYGKNKIMNVIFPSKNVRENDGFTVSSSDRVIPEQPKNDIYSHDRERMSSRSSMNSLKKHRTTCEPPADLAGINLKSRKHVGNESEENSKLAKSILDPVERPAPLARYVAFVEANTSPSTRFKDSEKSMQPHLPLANENQSSIGNSNRLFGSNVRTFPEYVTGKNTVAVKNKVGMQVPGLDNSSPVLKESRSALSPRKGDRNIEKLDNCSRHIERKKCAAEYLGGVDRQDKVSDTSMVDSASGLNISPDVVVGVIGEKQFWKARKAIVHQQRIFAVQVFELHRLIKVQKLIAESPHILLEDYLGKQPSIISTVKSKLTECARPPLASATAKDSYQKSILNGEFTDKSPVIKLPPPFGEDKGKLHTTPQTSNEPHLKNIPQTPTATTTKPEPWCLNPIPGNQWLVPVMSPSEGLIYKPYAGPGPQNAGFIAPTYGNCRPMGLNTGSGDFFPTAYAVPASHHHGVGFFPGTIPMNQAYFPQYGIPVPNQSMSGSVTDQMSLFASVKSVGQENKLSTGDVNYLRRQQSSGNLPSQVSNVLPVHVRRFRGSDVSELQGSTASSPSERGNGDVLPLFPTEPTVDESSRNAESSENKSRAIKVVPHNPKSASESAARIFQKIQEERKQL